METQKPLTEAQPTSDVAKPAVEASCRKIKSDNDGSFIQEVKDHIDEFIHASMEEHQSCFTKTIRKMFGMSKIVDEKNAEAMGVESSLPLQTRVYD